MSKFIGRKSAVGVGLETVRGTSVVASKLLGKTDYNLEDKANKARSGEGMGNIVGEGSQAVVTQKMAEGDISAEAGAKSLPMLLSAVFGGAITSAAETSDYKHTIAEGQSNQAPTLSILVDDDNGDLLFRGAMVDSFELTIAMDEFVSFSAGLKSFVSRDTTFSPTSLKELDYKFVGRDLEFKVAAATTDLAAATAVCLKDFSLTVNKNTDYDMCLGTLEPEDILNKQITIQGSLTLNYEDRTWRDYMLDGDYKAIGIKLTNTRETMNSENPEMYLEFPRVDFSEWEAQRGNDDIVGQTINFNILLDIDNDRFVSSAYVINDVVSY